LKTNGGKYFNQVLNVELWVCFQNIFSKNENKSGIATSWIVQRVIEKWVRSYFVVAWTLTTIREVGDKFH
jgi:hypothetical protein